MPIFTRTHRHTEDVVEPIVAPVCTCEAKVALTLCAHGPYPRLVCASRYGETSTLDPVVLELEGAATVALVHDVDTAAEFLTLAHIAKVLGDSLKSIASDLDITVYTDEAMPTLEMASFEYRRTVAHAVRELKYPNSNVEDWAFAHDAGTSWYLGNETPNTPSAANVLGERVAENLNKGTWTVVEKLLSGYAGLAAKAHVLRDREEAHRAQVAAAVATAEEAKYASTTVSPDVVSRLDAALALL